MSGNRLTSVTNAVRLIKSFTSTRTTWGVSELSRELGISKSSVHRILATLTDEGMLEQDPESGRYRLGLAMYDLVAAVPSQRDLHEAVLLPMTELRNRTGETVQVGVLDGLQVVYIERLDSPNTLRLFTDVGRRNEVHCTGTGKALLANLPPDRRDRILGELDLTKRTAYTITSPRRFRQELDKSPCPGIRREPTRVRGRCGFDRSSDPRHRRGDDRRHQRGRTGRTYGSDARPDGPGRSAGRGAGLPPTGLPRRR